MRCSGLRLLSVLILLFYCTFTAISQTGITVKEFKELPNDMDARVVRPVYDQNGKTCALVKIVTTEGDFFFDNGLLGITEVVHKPELSEWWVYMPAKTMKLKITHPVYGQLNDTEDGYYYFPGQLREASCYRMELTTLRKTVIYEQERIKTGFLILNTTPDGGQVYLTENGVENYIGNAQIQKKLPYGIYNYRIKKSMYHDEVGVVEINNSRVEQNIVLRPAFGSLRVNTKPDGATVTFDNDSRTYITPCVIDMLQSGEHRVNIMAPLYAAQSKVISVEESLETVLEVELEPRFAEVYINTLPEANILLNGSNVGVGNYYGKLEEGIYDIEVMLAGHRNATRQIEVVAKQTQKVELNPIPICGSLDIVTSPIYANIMINGKNYGTTPATIDNLLIGDYEVVLSKQGCAPVRKQVTITENNLTVIETDLPQGCEVTITSREKGDQVYIDEIYVGLTPYSGMVSFGEHKVELRQGDKSISKEVNLPTTEIYRNIEIEWNTPKVHWARVNDVQRAEIQALIDNMVLVEGGTFWMGATLEQIDDAESDERPIQNVTLNDYFICKYEVTQSLWEAVMGRNPSHYKGANLPVENVSWDDCQKFLSKLNKLTGLKFRLPTEAEWEYAARGGKKSKEYKYSGSDSINDVAWNSGNSSNTTHPVGTKAPNELGIYDMSGNVYEWCSDRYGYYGRSLQVNPTGPTKGSARVLRGGSWGRSATQCRVSSRNSIMPSNRVSNFGFRVVCKP